MDLRPYQREAEAAILGEWDAGILRTLLVLPTGCGKTIVFSKVIEDRVRAVTGCWSWPTAESCWNRLPINWRKPPDYAAPQKRRKNPALGAGTVWWSGPYRA